MATKIQIPVTATNEVKSNPIVRKQNTIVYAGPVGSGTVTAGTLTVTAKIPDSTVFETPKDSAGSALNTIDLAAPETLNLFGPIQQYEFTITGFAGTATEIFLSLNTFD